MPCPTYSFEFFPPKSDSAESQFWLAIPELAELKPSFMTVTYGAGGSTRDKTIDIAEALGKKTGVPIAAHVTFINHTKKDIYALSDKLWDSGVRHVIALRGDLPADLSWPLDPDQYYFQRTSEFVAALHARHEFEISVAAYPEKHPDAPSIDEDIRALKKKCEAGATRAITQFFFENDKFYDFVDKCRAAGINTPICPGLLPIHDFKAMMKFAARCKATIPSWLIEKFEKVEGKPDDAKKLATDLLVEQTLDLAAHNVSHIHFYTLNKPGITREACEALQG